MFDRSSDYHEKSRVSFFTSRELSIIAVFSALGGAFSFPLGYAGNFLTSIPLIPFGAGQILSGLHVFWIALASVIVNKKGGGSHNGSSEGSRRVSSRELPWDYCSPNIHIGGRSTGPFPHDIWTRQNYLDLPSSRFLICKQCPHSSSSCTV